MVALYNHNTSAEIPQETMEVMQSKKLYPSVSILLPVDNKYPHFKEDEQRLKAMAKKAEERIRKEVAVKMAASITGKLWQTVESIDFTRLNRSVAVFVSPSIQKVIHLPVPVEEKLIVGRSFELRDLLYAAKHYFNYMVITLSENRVRLFRGYNYSLEEMDNENMPMGIKDTGGKGRSRVQSFSRFGSGVNVSDSKKHQEKKIEKYLYNVDSELSAMLQNNNMPIIVGGLVKQVQKFRSISSNKDKIIGSFEGSFDLIPPHQILERAYPVLLQKFKEEEKKAFELLEVAMSKKMCATGIAEVWRAVMLKQGRLLMVEKNYRCPAKFGKDKFTLITRDVKENGATIINDAVDDAIEFIIQNGGDVIFVEDDSLRNYGRIALITFFELAGL